MDEAKALERLAEKFIRDIEVANRTVATLVETLEVIENLAEKADTLDLRSSFSLKSDLQRLRGEIDELTRYLRPLERQLTEANSAIRKALY